jgi:hypothetical protein
MCSEMEEFLWDIKILHGEREDIHFIGQLLVMCNVRNYAAV